MLGCPVKLYFKCIGCAIIRSSFCQRSYQYEESLFFVKTGIDFFIVFRNETSASSAPHSIWTSVLYPERSFWRLLKSPIFACERAAQTIEFSRHLLPGSTDTCDALSTYDWKGQKQNILQLKITGENALGASWLGTNKALLAKVLGLAN